MAPLDPVMANLSRPAASGCRANKHLQIKAGLADYLEGNQPALPCLQIKVLCFAWLCPCVLWLSLTPDLFPVYTLFYSGIRPLVISWLYPSHPLVHVIMTSLLLRAPGSSTEGAVVKSVTESHRWLFWGLQPGICLEKPMPPCGVWWEEEGESLHSTPPVYPSSNWLQP